MKSADATAEVFVTAFEALPRVQREAVLKRLLTSAALREDVIDVARWLERKCERSVSYDTVRKRLRAAGCL